ncbi:MAG: hypothetical protein ACFB20_05045 [Opitutales bacterium]
MLVLTGCEWLGIGKQPQATPEEAYLAYVEAEASGDVETLVALTIGGTDFDRELTFGRARQTQLSHAIHRQVRTRFGDAGWEALNGRRPGSPGPPFRLRSESVEDVVEEARAELQSAGLEVDVSGDTAIIFDPSVGRDPAYAFLRRTYRGWLHDLGRQNPAELEPEQRAEAARRLGQMLEALEAVLAQAEDPRSTLEDVRQAKEVYDVAMGELMGFLIRASRP